MIHLESNLLDTTDFTLQMMVLFLLGWVCVIPYRELAFSFFCSFLKI